MKTLSTIALITPAMVGAMALTLATPADAQSRYGYNDRDRGSDRTGDALLGAAVGALAGALLGGGDGTYVAGGALAGAALGASANRGDSCEYYRGGQCYRNQGHWEREHGIDRNAYGSSYGYDRGDYNRGYRDQRSQQRDYRYDRRW